MILDEPTSALDPVGREDVRAIIRDARDRGSAVLLNSHLLGEVERLCDNVAIVNRGRVVAAGSLAELLGEQAVRLRVTDLPAAAASALAAFGPVTTDDEGWLVIRPVDPDRDPGPRRRGRGGRGARPRGGPGPPLARGPVPRPRPRRAERRGRRVAA